MFENIVLEISTLAGFAALVSLVINVLKYFGIVKDGTADKWVATFNLIGVIGLFVTRLLIPDFNVTPIDNTMSTIAVVGSYVFSYIVMILGSKLTYLATKGLPVIGHSNTTAQG